MSFNHRSISEVHNMAQMDMSPEMQFIFQSRDSWRGSVALSPEVQKAIVAVRAEVKSGTDSDGWKTVAKSSTTHTGRSKAPEASGYTSYNSGSASSTGGQPVRGGGAGGDRFGHLNTTQHHSRNDNYRGNDRGNDRGNGSHNRNGGSQAPGYTGGQMSHRGVKPQPITSGARAPTLFAASKSSSVATAPFTQSAGTVVTEVPKTEAPSYNKSMFRRADKTIDEIIIDRLQGYLTKFAESNYDYTKTQMINFLESDDNLSILPEFMRRFFKLAATSDLYYHLYARLLSELDKMFPYIHEEIGRLYKNFLDIFKELSDVEVSVYDTEAFNKYCDGKKYRTGYSRFITELIKYNSIESDYFLILVETIVNSLDASSRLPGKSETVQELASCIEQIIKVLLSTKENPYIGKMREAFSTRFKAQITELTKASDDRPSLVFRARYIMEGIENV
jgi:hypothetical protein